jgi:hypothetical protein
MDFDLAVENFTFLTKLPLLYVNPALYFNCLAPTLMSCVPRGKEKQHRTSLPTLTTVPTKHIIIAHYLFVYLLFPCDGQSLPQLLLSVA